MLAKRYSIESLLVVFISVVSRNSVEKLNGQKRKVAFILTTGPLFLHIPPSIERVWGPHPMIYLNRDPLLPSLGSPPSPHPLTLLQDITFPHTTTWSVMKCKAALSSDLLTIFQGIGQHFKFTYVVNMVSNSPVWVISYQLMSCRRIDLSKFRRNRLVWRIPVICREMDEIATNTRATEARTVNCHLIQFQILSKL